MNSSSHNDKWESMILTPPPGGDGDDDDEGGWVYLWDPASGADRC